MKIKSDEIVNNNSSAAGVFPAEAALYYIICKRQSSIQGHANACVPLRIFQESRSLSSASLEPEALLNRFSSCSTVRFFFSSPETSTTTCPSYIITRRLP